MSGGSAIAQLGAAPRGGLAPTPIIERYADHLDEYARAQPITTSILVPRADLPAVLAELERSLAPAAPQAIQLEVAKLMAAFAPGLRNVASTDLQFLAASFAEDLGTFPADIVQETTRRARQQLRFLVISDVIAIAETIARERRRQLAFARRMLQEHERRASEREEDERWRAPRPEQRGDTA